MVAEVRESRTDSTVEIASKNYFKRAGQTDRHRGGGSTK